MISTLLEPSIGLLMLFPALGKSVPTRVVAEACLPSTTEIKSLPSFFWFVLTVIYNLNLALIMVAVSGIEAVLKEFDCIRQSFERAEIDEAGQRSKIFGWGLHRVLAVKS